MDTRLSAGRKGRTAETDSRLSDAVGTTILRGKAGWREDASSVPAVGGGFFPKTGVR